MKPRILLVDDDPATLALLGAELPSHGFDVTVSPTADDAFDRMRDGSFDVVVTDLQLRGMNGLELCERIVRQRKDIPVLVITAFGSLETAISAIRVGAYDFITKPFALETLVAAIARAAEHRALSSEVGRLREAVKEHSSRGALTGESPAIRNIARLVDRIAMSDASVLITGESGTGKEVLARALHERGTRARGPFVAINCAAVPEHLLESELFGHSRGAFTDAKESKTGLFVAADRGTLFLDEVGDMPLAMQAKLLRALQTRVVRPVGGSREIAFDARIVTATNRDLETAVSEGRFREDLFFRINVVHIDVPPLRARGRDILLLAQQFVDAFAARARKRVVGISPEAAKALLDYAWPGNVRELENAIERAVALTTFETLAVDDLPERIRTHVPQHVVVHGDDPSELVTLEELEQRYIARVLEATGKNKVHAARILGIDRATLYRKLGRSATCRKAPQPTAQPTHLFDHETGHDHCIGGDHA